MLFGQFRQACIAGVGPTSTPWTPPSHPTIDGDRHRGVRDIAPNSAADAANGHGYEPMTAIPICADKWCLFRNPSPPLTMQTTEEAVRERMKRTGIADGIDILQIHWQDYSQPQVYLDVFRQLLELRGSRGVPRRLRIDVLGLVNFDSKRVNEICEAMGPGEILTNQVQVCISHLAPRVFVFVLHPFDFRNLFLKLFLRMLLVLVPFAAPVWTIAALWENLDA